MSKRVRRSNKSKRSNNYEPNVSNMLNDLEYESTVSTIDSITKEYEQKYAELQEQYNEKLRKATECAFLMMLHFPLEVLLKYYWTKASKGKLEKFIERILALYEEYNAGKVDIVDIQQHLFEHSGIRIVNDE